MRLDVPVDDVVLVAVLQGEQDLAHVVAAHGLAVHEAGRRALHDLEAQVRASHELEHHVQHALGTEANHHGNYVNEHFKLVFEFM